MKNAGNCPSSPEPPKSDPMVWSDDPLYSASRTVYINRLRRQRDRLLARLIALGVALVGIAFLLQACTVTPKTVHNSQASFDGNAQNSGLLGYDAAGNRIITMHARDRYNALIGQYGGWFHPPIQADANLSLTSSNACVLSAQGAFYFATMNRWSHQGGPPTPTPKAP